MSLLNPLYYAVAWVLQQIFNGLTFIGLPATGGLTWVLTIVILVVLMRLILVPLFIKQMHATRKMAALAPQLQELRKKYKNDKETLNAETMRLYRENGANPLAGCLPLVAQMPMFFALFSVLRAIALWNPGTAPQYGLTSHTVESAKQADILGAHISDKVLFTGTMYVPLEAKFVIVGAVIISVLTTFMTVRQNTKRGMTPTMTPSDSPLASSQKLMQYIVPLFALSGLYWQFGLVLYWVTTNVWTLGQQWVLFKRYPTPVTAAAGGGAAAAPQAGPSPAGPSGQAGGAAKKPGKASAGAGGGGGKAARTGSDGAAAKSVTAKGAVAKGAAAPGGAGSANGSSLRRRLGRGRSEPEPQEVAPEVKLVRQQRVHQSRSKRSGKR